MSAAAPSAPQGGPLTLVVDVRERGREGRTGLVEALQAYLAHYNATLPKGALPLSFLVEALDMGDIVARRRDGTLADAVERKTLQDMASTLAPGSGAAQRYHSQKESMKKVRDNDGASLCYLFEVQTVRRGFMDPACTAERFAPTNVRASSLRGMVMNTRVRDRIETDFSENVHATAVWVVARFLALARFEHAVGTEAPSKRRAAPLSGGVVGDGAAELRQLAVTATRKRKEADATPVTRTADLLAQVPLVGPEDALALARHFGSVAALSVALPAAEAQDYRALVKELRALFGEIKGVGEKTALALYATLHACDAPAKPAPVKRAPSAAAPGAAAARKPAAKRQAGPSLPAVLHAARLARPAGTERRPIEVDMAASGEAPVAAEDEFGDALDA